MTASTQAKNAGLKSLATVSVLTGVHRVTLERWASDKPKLLKAVIRGCVAIQDDRNSEEGK